MVKTMGLAVRKELVKSVRQKYCATDTGYSIVKAIQSGCSHTTNSKRGILLSRKLVKIGRFPIVSYEYLD